MFSSKRDSNARPPRRPRRSWRDASRAFRARPLRRAGRPLPKKRRRRKRRRWRRETPARACPRRLPLGNRPARRSAPTRSGAVSPNPRDPPGRAPRSRRASRAPRRRRALVRRPRLPAAWGRRRPAAQSSSPSRLRDLARMRRRPRALRRPASGRAPPRRRRVRLRICRRRGLSDPRRRPRQPRLRPKTRRKKARPIARAQLAGIARVARSRDGAPAWPTRGALAAATLKSWKIPEGAPEFRRALNHAQLRVCAASHFSHSAWVPRKAFWSTLPGIPGTAPSERYCQKVQLREP